MFEWTARFRLPILLGALAIGVLYAVTGVVRTDRVQPLLLIGMGLVNLVLFLGAFYAGARYRPAALVARPDVPAFDVPVSPALVLGAALATTLGTAMGAGIVEDALSGDAAWVVAVLFAGLFVVLIAWWWALALGRFGVRLRPDGIEDRQSLGATFIPWEAFDGVDFPAHAGSPHRILLNVSRPGLVRKRGRRSGEITVVSSLSTDSVFLAGVIHWYAHRPEARAAIGTESERDRLVSEWGGGAAIR
ncbi:hypothetical protein [Actinoplanes utahensis]|uniref:PH domain-containing protein n=1 Tax=Actinoplanes utahensis TaxID=1869 RepID=A0A0A6X984_ACTUT|nr:hypothetical protein [Actinoplanes utahensis]KHD76682.1 hypothetical protein MB27_15440 [Actinoplanes utahensis]GIF33263.1 hypothetical protein Aut01nite_62490 [Actinoplanes utahensis]